MSESDNSNESVVQTAIEITLRLGFLLLLAAWSFQILYPFLMPVLWAIIISISVSGLYTKLKSLLRGRSGLASTVYVLVFLSILLIPTYFFMESLVVGISDFGNQLANQELKIPAANPEIATIPVIGKPLFAAWDLGATNLESAMEMYAPQLAKVGKALLGSIAGIGTGALLFAFSIIISGILLANAKAGEDFTKKLFRKIVGARGDEFVQIAEITIKNVTKGILGVALIQAFLVGAGLILAGVPYAGLWTFLVLILAIVQLPASLITIPVIIYLFSALSPLPATLWAVYLFIAGASDNVLKPILLGKGAPVPMLVIFLGSIGGFMASGFIGLFIGAIVLSLSYKLFETWVGTADNVETTKEKPEPEK